MQEATGTTLASESLLAELQKMELVTKGPCNTIEVPKGTFEMIVQIRTYPQLWERLIQNRGGGDNGTAQTFQLLSELRDEARNTAEALRTTVEGDDFLTVHYQLVKELKDNNDVVTLTLFIDYFRMNLGSLAEAIGGRADGMYVWIF
jgi:hypothetical protein